MGALVEGQYQTTVARVELSVGGMSVEAIHARPVGSALLGLVVSPDIGGIRPLFEDVCRRLATHGFAVCAVEPFARFPLEDRQGWGMAERMESVRLLHDEVQLGDLAAAADHLEAVDHVSSVAVMGFCMGGYYTLKAASTGRFERAVSFYGMVRTPEHWASLGHVSPIDMLENAGPTLAIFGDNDSFVPSEDVEALRALWADKPDHKVVVYRGAEHGFVHDPDRSVHREDDAADAWRRAMSFLLE